MTSASGPGENAGRHRDPNALENSVSGNTSGNWSRTTTASGGSLRA
ncbi:hypothetical protein [Streptomyces erythrochromogenes]